MEEFNARGQEVSVNLSGSLDEYTWNILHSGYMGMEGMLHRRRKWGMAASKTQLLSRLRGCNTCRRNCRVYKSSQMGSLNDSVKPNEIVGMDFIGSVNGRYLLLIMDFLPRRTQVNVYRKANGESVLDGLQIWVQECGPVRKVVSDQGRQFSSEQVRH